MQPPTSRNVLSGHIKSEDKTHLGEFWDSVALKSFAPRLGIVTSWAASAPDITRFTSKKTFQMAQMCSELYKKLLNVGFGDSSFSLSALVTVKFPRDDRSVTQAESCQSAGWNVHRALLIFGSHQWQQRALVWNFEQFKGPLKVSTI